MFQVLRNAWKITDLRKKILYTLFIILIFRIGSAITIPFIDAAAIANAVNSSNTGFEFLTLMSGGGFSNGGDPSPGADGQGRRGGPQKAGSDHPVHHCYSRLDAGRRVLLHGEE